MSVPKRISTIMAKWRRLDERGAAALEFALALPVLLGLVAAVVEFGMMQLGTILMESALRDASRFAVTGRTVAGQSREDAIRAVIADRTIGLIDMSAATVTMLVYPSFSRVGQGEGFVDGNGNGSFDAGETFTDENGNGAWDADIGKTGAGGAGDVVVYRITYNWPLLTPYLAGLIGIGGAVPIQAAVAVRNETWPDPA